MAISFFAHKKGTASQIVTPSFVVLYAEVPREFQYHNSCLAKQ